MLYEPGVVNPADYVSKVTPPEKNVNNEHWIMSLKFLENDNEQIVTEYAVDRISENVNGNTLENILDDIEEKQKNHDRRGNKKDEN